MGDMTIRDLLNFDWLQLQVSTVVITIVSLVILVTVITVLWRNNNRLQALDMRCNTAAADIDAQLKHRHNLIPGLVEAVRGFMGHENEVLIAVAEANAAALGATTAMARHQAETMLGNSVNSLLSAAQLYPDLKASGHFKDLEQQLIDVENRVTAARRFYNLAIEEYNTQLGIFPGNLVARLQKRVNRAPFRLEDGARTEIDAPLAFKF
ncbi:MAG TPA: LemA family protein [Sphingomicrobium sp.]|jgi:LemA protein|nr:LemA family protein [Sphingomicrobium sp.]